MATILTWSLSSDYCGACSCDANERMFPVVNILDALLQIHLQVFLQSHRYRAMLTPENSDFCQHCHQFFSVGFDLVKQCFSWL